MFGYLYRAFPIKEKILYKAIRSWAIATTSFSATTFRKSILTDVDFFKANLQNADLREAVMLRTNWHCSENLFLACSSKTILSIPVVRQLAVTHDGRRKSYIGCDLRGINLKNAELSDATLEGAELSDAALEGASLARTNLTKIQALRTQFRHANLTAACLESWNIDSTTQLEGVICDHVYLLNGQQERRPNSGNFAPGEFTKLFQEVLDTIDLIFRDGVDWKAFVQTFRDIQVQNEDADLAIQSIENKGDGVVVVKVKASEGTDKAKVHADFSATYELKLQALEAQYRVKLEAKDSEIQVYREKSASMEEIAKLLAQRPINIEATAVADSKSFNQTNYGGTNFQNDISGGEVNQAETINLERTSVTNNVEGATIGNFANQMSGNASQTYNAAPDKSLAEAAQEIQALLDQLSQSYPSETMLQKAQFADAAATQAKANHTLRQRLLSAVDAGTIGAIEELLSHPVVTFFIDAVKDWEENKPQA